LTTTLNFTRFYHHDRGHVALKLGRLEESEAHYDKAMEVNPGDSWSWLERGLARKQRGRVEAAVADLSRSALLEPNAPNAWGSRGEIYGEQRRWDEAARDFDRWAALGGESMAIPWYFHAALRLYANDEPGYERACKAMMQRFALNRDPFVKSLVAHACTLGKDSGERADRVVALAEATARARPRDAWVTFTLATALRRAGRPEAALAKLEKAARVNPEWTGVPLIAALRELIQRASRARKEGDPGAGHLVASQRSSELVSINVQKELRKRKAPWQFELEGSLLGRELDAGRSASAAAVGAR
jgi:tetratricopeptide (TPR) repeat protein